MSGTTIAYDTDVYMDPALPGLLADLQFTDKVVIACGPAPQPFGSVVGMDTATGVSALPVANAQGIAIRETAYGGRAGGQAGAYVQYDAIAVCKRGRIWALASGACTKGGPVKYDPTTGIVGDAGTATLAKAKFVTGDVTLTGLIAGAPTRRIVQVELHEPTA